MKCACGCGQETFIADRNDVERGWVKGQPINYVRGHNSRSSFIDRIFKFWSKIHIAEGGCLEWTGQLHKENGYGVFLPTFKTCQAHRIAYILTNGEIPSHLELDHLCRNRRCVNPTHLEAVTRKINARRGARAKLSFQQADEIRNSKEPTRFLVARYGVSRATVKCIRGGRAWS